MIEQLEKSDTENLSCYSINNISLNRKNSTCNSSICNVVAATEEGGSIINYNDHSSKSLSQSNNSTTDDEKLPLCFTAKRHQSAIEGIVCETQSWRIRERVRTILIT